MKTSMREISPALGMTADEFLSTKPPKIAAIAREIRAQKASRTRAKPSQSLMDRSAVLNGNFRVRLLDSIADLVDENLFGRSEMCIQFAILLHRSLLERGIGSRPASGTAIYFRDGKEIFRWSHAWVRVGDEVIDGNADILHENPEAPQAVRVRPYWGPISDILSDRRLREEPGSALPEDPDVESVWWPELRASV